MMSNQISTFDFKSNPVRVELFKNEPHFCLTDVRAALDISNANSSRFKFNESGVHKMYSVDKLDRKNELTFINEPNLYRIIFRSNKSQAIEFQNWVFEEVLPTIRKTGSYSTQQQIVLPEPEPIRKIKISNLEFEALLVVLNKFTPMAQQFAEIVKAQHRQLYDVLALERHVRNPTAAKAHDIAYEFNYWIKLARNALNRYEP